MLLFESEKVGGIQLTVPLSSLVFFFMLGRWTKQGKSYCP